MPRTPKLAARIATGWPQLGNETVGPPVRHFLRELDMGSDRALFDGFFEGMPVYEGRMVDQFDHRAKAYRSGRGRAAVWEELSFDDTRKAIVPQWRIPQKNIPNKLGDRPSRYRVGWCDVAAARNERSLVAALIPPGVICGHTVPTMTFPADYEWTYMTWLSIANSFCADYLLRSRVTLHMSMTVLDSLPFPRYPVDHPLVNQLVPLALRLTCTSPEMTHYWNSMAQYGWCEVAPSETVPATALIGTGERAAARAEIDAIVAKHVYGLTSEELSSVLDQFPVLEKRDRKAHGSYVTKDRILQRYESV